MGAWTETAYNIWSHTAAKSQPTGLEHAITENENVGHVSYSNLVLAESLWVEALNHEVYTVVGCHVAAAYPP
jgi:catabolite regulation protein CreA